MRRNLEQAVIVITGASSGIGRATALAAARRGATLVLAARSRAALEDVARAADALGAASLVVPTDVAHAAACEALAAAAVSHFGRIDVWVNNAAVAEFAYFDDMTPVEMERIVDVALLGTMYGAKAALPRLERSGGVLINVASVLADVGIPLQSAYVAAKHGVKGFTESLRMELRAQGSRVRACLVLPGSIDTPLFTHARVKIGTQPGPMTPVYRASEVAKAILATAVRPAPEVYVGGAAKAVSLLKRLSPRAFEWLALHGDPRVSGSPGSGLPRRPDGLFEPSVASAESGGHAERAGASWYNVMQRAVQRATRAAAGVGALVAIGTAVYALAKGTKMRGATGVIPGLPARPAGADRRQRQFTAVPSAPS